MNTTIKPKPCKQCGSLFHTPMYHKPRKPIQTKAVPKQRTPLPRPTKRPNQRGKGYKKWLETKEKWFETNKQPYYYCHYCNKLMTRSQLTLDHKIPRSRAPELIHAKKNLVPCCFICNSLKGSIDHDTYLHNCHE
jgi:5-methylcytosine-specific restriction endonuclease McrA